MSYNVGVIMFPGSNCVQETIDFFNFLECNVSSIFHKETNIPKLDLYVLPGGFSYGDYIRTGMLSSKSPVMNEIEKHARQGSKVLGICNGFQILCERKMLPGTLRKNKNLTFICDIVRLLKEDSDWSNADSFKQYVLPIAHGEGNYYHTNPSEVNVAYRYSYNFNGSVENIAGIYSDGGNVLGMMPHPERAFKGYHHSEDGIEIVKQFMEK
tara:strand:- start:883 stop:1515 length:633 start_codon:yes stop_codon:yes gene_type:complete